VPRLPKIKINIERRSYSTISTTLDLEPQDPQAQAAATAPAAPDVHHEEEDQLALEATSTPLRRIPESPRREGQVSHRRHRRQVPGRAARRHQAAKSKGILPFRELSLAIEPKELKVGRHPGSHDPPDRRPGGQLYLSEAPRPCPQDLGKGSSKRHDNDEVIEATVTQKSSRAAFWSTSALRGFVPGVRRSVRTARRQNLDELVRQEACGS